MSVHIQNKMLKNNKYNYITMMVLYDNIYLKYVYEQTIGLNLIVIELFKLL